MGVLNKSKIEWCDFTWNPITGCLHGCEYCYAKRMIGRFARIECPDCKNRSSAPENICDGCDYSPDCETEPGLGCEFCEYMCNKCNNTRLIPDPDAFKPKFHPDRLDQPAKRKKPARIFVVSMGDLFGEWVPDEWIERVFEACEAAPQHTYYFLTKNPIRYSHWILQAFDDHKNWWYGTSETGEKSPPPICSIHYGNQFISAEPLRGPWSFSTHWPPKWLIVGSETRNGRAVNMPKEEWLLYIREQCKALDIPLFEKNSLAGLNLPGGLIQQWPEEA